MAESPGTHYEDLLTCSICLEIYDNPQILQCLHTYCRACVESLMQNLNVQCPECREYSSIDDIKKDFKTQSFLVAYHSLEKHRSLETEDVSKYPKVPKEILDDTQNVEIDVEISCQSCKTLSKPVKSYCTECDRYMCGDCENVHNSFPACVAHKLKTLTDLQDEAKAEVQEVLGKYESHRKLLKQKLASVTNFKDQLNSVENEAIMAINKNCTKWKQEIEEYHSNLIDDVKEAVNKYKDNVLVSEKVLQQGVFDVDTKIQDLARLKQSVTDNILKSKKHPQIASEVELQEIAFLVEQCKIGQLPKITVIKHNDKINMSDCTSLQIFDPNQCVENEEENEDSEEQGATGGLLATVLTNFLQGTATSFQPNNWFGQATVIGPSISTDELRKQQMENTMAIRQRQQDLIQEKLKKQTSAGKQNESDSHFKTLSEMGKILSEQAKRKQQRIERRMSKLGIGRNKNTNPSQGSTSTDNSEPVKSPSYRRAFSWGSWMGSNLTGNHLQDQTEFQNTTPVLSSSM